MSIESCNTVSITKLKEWGYLNYGIKSGIISWSSSGEVLSRIGIKSTILEHEKFITLDYKQSGESINYNVRIVSIPSNLGKGEILYFVCPNTGKHCRKLYHNSKYFLHREAYRYLYYEKQLESKKSRFLVSIFDKVFIKDEVYAQIYKKHFKTHYNGKETKRYKKILDKIKLAESFPSGTFERLLMM
ncbi:hypothetical protein [Flavobacterium sp. K5-23]|uniref:hypothetical protein n=1 Tax=Flavobacterium sp. K5-23 TaxID=2746225 RepID=UPI00200D7655|nr:hypothetical protein [Flavobacterium sp. K5-23]UQD54999.1 hypothetical protein FLAK523_00785 [Flavobacterium sp. K5-23]